MPLEKASYKGPPFRESETWVEAASKPSADAMLPGFVHAYSTVLSCVCLFLPAYYSCY